MILTIILITCEQNRVNKNREQKYLQRKVLFEIGESQESPVDRVSNNFE